MDGCEVCARSAAAREAGVGGGVGDATCPISTGGGGGGGAIVGVQVGRPPALLGLGLVAAGVAGRDARGARRRRDVRVHGGDVGER